MIKTYPPYILVDADGTWRRIPGDGKRGKSSLLYVLEEAHNRLVEMIRSEEAAKYKRRIDELLESNNALLERARKAEAEPSEETLSAMVKFGQTRAISSKYTWRDYMRDLAAIVKKGEEL